MPPEIQRRCLECFYSQPGEPTAHPTRVLIGDESRLCLQGPPTTFPLMTAQGLAFMTIYPTVNAQTTSCRQFAADLRKYGVPEEAGH